MHLEQTGAHYGWIVLSLAICPPFWTSLSYEERKNIDQNHKAMVHENSAMLMTRQSWR